MRPIPKDVPLIDGEGFPQGMKESGKGRDEESGELVTTKIHYLRKHPDLRLSPRIDSLLFSDMLDPRLSKRRANGFRIQDFTRGRAWEETWIENRQRSRRKNPHQLETCVYMKGGEPLHFTRRPLDAPTGLDIVRREEYAVRPMFRVPRESLPKPPIDQPRKKPNTVCVNIWEEFLFGKGVLASACGQTRENQEETREEEETEEGEEEGEGSVNYVRRILNRLLPKFVVDLMVYATYFLIFFSSCVGYNMYCELGCYILLAQHLQIHEKAYEKKLDVMFTGSIFQGPLYALTRNWCEHCNEWERAQVMMRLMKKMKADILLHAKSNTNTTKTQEDTEDPP